MEANSKMDGIPVTAARRAVRQRLEDLARAGVTLLPRHATVETPGAVESLEQPNQTDTPLVASAAARQVLLEIPSDRVASERPSREWCESQLSILNEQVRTCVQCDELVANRTQTVFGVGSVQPRLCFMGEAPGADEDRLGEPFVGRAGQLLNRIIEACGMKREDVYILNTLKCRPPQNRNPLPHEAANCRPFLDRQLEILQPEFICCLGAVAAQSLLETDVAIGRMRGKVHDYRGIRVVCTYHPAYLLRNPAAKRDTWQDMQLLMREMGIEIPSS
jgi:DNA polymerase